MKKQNNTQLPVAVRRITEAALRDKSPGKYPKQYTLAYCLQEATIFRLQMGWKIITLMIGLIMAEIINWKVAVYASKAQILSDKGALVQFAVMGVALVAGMIMLVNHIDKVSTPGKKILDMADDAARLQKKIRANTKFLENLEFVLPEKCGNLDIPIEALSLRFRKAMEATLIDMARELKNEFEDSGQEYRRGKLRKAYTDLYNLGVEMDIGLNKAEGHYFDKIQTIAVVKF